MASSIINSDDGSVSGTTGLKTTGGDDGELAFESSGTEAMRIDSSGNVGIGTSSPAAPLTVNHSTSAGIRCESGGTLMGGFQANTSDAIVYAYSSNPIRFSQGNGSTERMRIDSSGNVGIGTSSPVGPLSIGSGNTFYAQVGGIGSIVMVSSVYANARGLIEVDMIDVTTAGPTTSNIGATRYLIAFVYDGGTTLVQDAEEIGRVNLGLTAPTLSISGGNLVLTANMSSSSRYKMSARMIALY